MVDGGPCEPCINLRGVGVGGGFGAGEDKARKEQRVQDQKGSGRKQTTNLSVMVK